MTWTRSYHRDGDFLKLERTANRPANLDLVNRAEKLNADSVFMCGGNTQAIYSFTKDANGEWMSRLVPAQASTAIRRHHQKI